MGLPPLIQDHLQLWACGVIAFVGLAIIGFKDLLKFSAGRVWAISSVCFAESVRKRIWLITPLAIIGVIVVAQLQRPTDERDAIRQTIKFCLFATGLLVTVTAIILACTNLPREIESRVIYTIVTKPTTRLEIVLGKIVGFARVSALILLIMGVFTFAYLHFRAFQFEQEINARLKIPGEVDAVSRPTLQYYSDAGLLTARKMAFTDDMQIYLKTPQPGSDRRFVVGSGEGDLIVPFEVRASDMIPAGIPAGPDAVPGAGGLLVNLKIGVERIPGFVDPAQPSQSTLPQTVAAPASAATQPAAPAPAKLMVQFLDQNQNALFPSRELNGGQPIVVADASGQTPTQVMIPPASAELIYKPGSSLEKPLRFYVQVLPSSDGYHFFVDKDPVSILVAAAPGYQSKVVLPLTSRTTRTRAQPIFRGREGTSGQQIKGGTPADAPVAIYHFATAIPGEAGKSVTFEFKSGIERNAADSDDENTSTNVSFTAYNIDSGQESTPVVVPLESNHQSYFQIPAEFVQSGNFEIRVRCFSPGQYLGLFPTSLGMVRSLQGFDVNLIKSLIIMWMMAILVITIAIFTSTFVSWPTAIVLTVIILLGRWGVEQLGDATQPGIGNLIATDMGFTDPNKMKVVSSVTEALAGGLNMLAKVLPDISSFAATEDIEKGMVVPLQKLGTSAGVLFSYGLAVLAMAYVRLTWVEVAP